MRILVTGISGQVGRALLSQFAGQDIIGTDRALLDLTTPHAVVEVLDRLVPDIIINAAAYTSVDKAEEQPAVAMLVNGYAPGAIARWASVRGLPLIHISTDYVFDGSGNRPWQEDDQVSPLSIYGASKALGEQQIRAAGGCSLIIRTSWVYAAYGTNFLRTIARLARERRELRIVADQIGAPTPASLIARSVAEIVSQGQQLGFGERFAQAGGIVHLAASGETSWHGFASTIVRGLKDRGVRLTSEQIVPIRSDEYPTPAKRPLNSRLDMARLALVFNMVPPQWELVLADELDTVAQEFLEHPI